MKNGYKGVTQIESMVKSIRGDIINELCIIAKILMKHYFIYKKLWIITGVEMYWFTRDRK